MAAVDLIVVGGGVFGCAIAWSASQAGARVVLLERRTLGSQTTSRAASLLTRVRTKAGQSALVAETRRAIEALGAELGEPLDLRVVGSLHLAASEASDAALAELEGFAADIDEPFHAVTLDEVRARVPWLRTDELRRAVLMPDDATIDPYLLASAYARAARARGAQLREGVQVRGLLREGERVLGVETDDGPLLAGAVVSAAGPWSALLLAEHGVPLPMAPVRSHYWITENDPARFDPAQPFVILPDAQAYARTEVGGLLFGLRDRASLSRDPRALPEDLAELRFDEDPDGWEVLAEQGAGFARFFPDLESIGLAHYVAGPSTYTPDGQFVLGPAPGLEGLWIATGCCGAGIAISGGVGAALAAGALGETPPLDLEPFALDRHGAVDAFDPAWQRRCAAARSAKTSG